MYKETPVDTQSIRAQFPLFKEKAQGFLDGTVNMKDFKGFSGKYGSYAQRGGKKFMLRLRMNAGHLTPEKLDFIIDQTKKHDVDHIHFTTCQAVQLHDLELEPLVDIMEAALDAGIVCYGGGGDFPRNVMCSPLTGIDPEEYFDVQPYAHQAANYLIHLVDAEKMPRKLKVAFASSPANNTHATFRDLGFVARPDGKFDVYAAGGLGVNPSIGIKVAEAVDPTKILYYIKAMRDLFLAHGNYKNRARARTRYMVEDLGGPEAFKEMFDKYLKEALNADLDIVPVPEKEIEKPADGIPGTNRHIKEQKQAGLYMYRWHPAGGTPDRKTLEDLSKLLDTMPETELRIDPDESVWVVNLTGKEADAVAALLDPVNAKSDFETSVSCVGATICQVGVRDSRSVLLDSIEAVRKADLPADALPQVFISGCASSCGTHQAGTIGLRGGVKVKDRKPVEVFTLFLYGKARQGEEALAEESVSIPAARIPEFFVTLGKTVAETGKSFEAWLEEDPAKLKAVAETFAL